MNSLRSEAPAGSEWATEDGNVSLRNRGASLRYIMQTEEIVIIVNAVGTIARAALYSIKEWG